MRSVYRSFCNSAKFLLRRFGRDNRANVAMMFGLSLVPMLIAAGAGIDFARGVMVHQRMGQALDAAALAVGNATSKPAACAATGDSGSNNACYALRQLAQQYFDLSYDHTQDATYGTPTAVAISISGQAVTLTSTLPLKLTLLGITPIGIASPTVSNSSTVVWGQTKLWVSLVLDNSGSMDQGDSSGSKMDALKDALRNSSYGLLKTLKDAAAVEGDVKVGIVPFAANVRPPSSGFSSYIDWSEWEGYPAVLGATPDDHKVVGFRSQTKSGGVEFSAFGPGDDCPFTDSGNGLRATYGFYCMRKQLYSTDSDDRRDTISTSGSSSSSAPKGRICPGRDSGTSDVQSHNYQYYNGCFTSTQDGSNKITVSSGSSASCNGFSSSNCTCTGSNSSKVCKTQKWIHAWVANTDHDDWNNCVTDRQRMTLYGSATTSPLTATKTGPRTAASKNYDASKDAPSSGETLFPTAVGSPACVAQAVLPFPSSWTASQWTTLDNKARDMDAGGSTNQGIGVAHGWHMLTPGAPYNTGISSVPEAVTRILILFSDGLNTQNRWWGNGQDENTTDDGYIDERTKAICQAAKDDGIIIYTVFVHIGTNGNSAALEDCASPAPKGKYYDLTSSAAIKDAFKDIAQKITNLRVSQ